MTEENVTEIDEDLDLDEEGEEDVEWYPLPDWLLSAMGDEEE